MFTLCPSRALGCVSLSAVGSTGSPTPVRLHVWGGLCGHRRCHRFTSLCAWLMVHLPALPGDGRLFWGFASADRVPGAPLHEFAVRGGGGGPCWRPSGPVTRTEEPPLLPGVESVHATPAQGAGGHVPTCAQPRMESDFGFAGRTPSSSTVAEPLSRTQSLKNRVFRSPVFSVVSAAFNAQGRCVLPTDRLSAPHSPRSHVFSMQNTCIFVSTVMAGFTCPLGGAVACRR